MRIIHRIGAVLVAGLLPVIGVEAYNSFELHQARRQEVQQGALRQASLASSELERIVEGVRGVMTAVSQAPSVQSMNTEACGQFIKGVIGHLEYLAMLRVVDNEGKVRCASSPAELGLDIGDRPYYKNSLTHDGLVVGEYLVGRLSHQATLPFALPIIASDGTRKGTVVSSLSLEWLSKQLLLRGLPQGGSITVADRTGTILARQPLPEKFVGTRIPAAFTRQMNEKEPGVIEVTSQDGTQRVLGYIPIPRSAEGFYVSAGLSTEQSFKSVTSASYRQAWITAIAVLGSVIGTLGLASLFIFKPLRQLSQTVRKWQEGDMTARTGLTERHGETGELGQEFDRTMDQLAKRDETINALIRELGHRAKNQLALVMAFMTQLAKNRESVADYKAAVMDRLMALADSQDLLVKSGGEVVDLEDLIHTQLRVFDLGKTDRIQIDGPKQSLLPDTARSLGMALHELATNATKYGALSNRDGRVKISWTAPTKASNSWEFMWEETGGPAVKEPVVSGFGRTLVERIVPAQMNGSATVSYQAKGLRWVLNCSADVAEAEDTMG